MKPVAGVVGKSKDPNSLYESSRSAYQSGDLARAISFADQLLALTQNAPQACGWAATLRLEAGDWQNAIRLARTGLAAGRSAALLGIAGQAHLAREELGPAETAFSEAIALQPDYAPWRFHLARVYLRMDREFEAMEALQKGVKLDPDPVCLIRLAFLELTYNAPEDALEHAIQGLQHDPSDVIGQTIAAKCLTELGKQDEADAHWRRAAELAGTKAEEIDLMRVRFLREHGRFDLAVSALDKVLEAHPDSIRANILLAESRRCTDSDLPFVRHMQSLAETTEASPTDEMNLAYALGKANDDLGRFEEAMRHFDRANAIGYQALQANGGFDRLKYGAQLAARKEIFSQKHIERSKSIGNQDASPIFVMGMMRSGTTLMEQILGRHPLVSGAGEQKFWIGLDVKLLDYDRLRLREDVLRVGAETYLRLLNRYRGNAQHVVDKQPGNLLLAAALHIAFPEARIIYMRRESLDNAVSIWNTNIQTSTSFVHDKGNLVFAIRQYESLMRHWEAVLPPNRFAVVSYESLVVDQEAETRRILEFCGLPWSDACLSPEKSRSKVITPSLWQVRQPVYTTSIGRWKNYEPWLGELRELS